MLNAEHLRLLVVRPTLVELDMWSNSAENLLMGTAAQESGLRHLRQLGGGPALGLYQMEPATHDDIWKNWLSHRPKMAARVGAFCGMHPDRHAQLVTNFSYATAMARIHYYRVPAPLPDADDIIGLGAYWKAHYNTYMGAGLAVEFEANYRRLLD